LYPGEGSVRPLGYNENTNGEVQYIPSDWPMDRMSQSHPAAYFEIAKYNEKAVATYFSYITGWAVAIAAKRLPNG